VIGFLVNLVVTAMLTAIFIGSSIMTGMLSR
jgi:hypothetical protein